MAKTEIPKISDDLIVGAAMNLYAHANEEGEIDPSMADGLTTLPVGNLSRLSMGDIERIGIEEGMARDRAAALARAAIDGTTADEIGSEQPTGLRGRLKKMITHLNF